MLLDFEIGNNKEVDHAEVMLEDTGNGSLLKKMKENGEIEWYIERLKQWIKMKGMNERTLKAQIT
ncbi:hypothetical protein HNP65_001237 [Thermosipho japonicus]|uniref:Uncharacterized protein n=1 Tax=Thermosipho japonicus TaxID=90323 RepID=A0A841GLB3_9BACT|nr:hypothetical protein [Thermosipho japonicus]